MGKDHINNSFITVIIDALLNIQDINEIACYGFDLKLKNGNKVKGVVRVEFEEVE